MNAGVVEHAELVLHEPVEILPAEPGPVDVKLLERPDEDIPGDTPTLYLA